MATIDLAATIAKARKHGRTALDEPAGKALLADFGIDVPDSRVVDLDDDVRRCISDLAGPYVLKVIAPGVLHKSDVGGVRLGLVDTEEVARAVEEMRADMLSRGIEPSGWLVEQMIPRGVELVVGGVTDPEFGPMVMVGLGGIFVEVLKDVAFRICPITLQDAREMLDDLRGAPLLHGARGRAGVSIDALVRTLVIFAGENGLFMQCASDIAEIDINPLIVTGHRAVAADARFVLRASA